MNNVNLIVSSSNGETWLDLYENQPIKMTFNLEDIVTTSPKAEFTQRFRCPATDNNYNFFETAFEINGADYNPGVRYSCRINIDGNDFRSGELRLQNVYRNDVTGKADYECVFIGAAKSLASEVGEKSLGQLDWSDYNITADLAAITSSWRAWPENSNQSNALLNGDVLFPIIDFGNTYDDNGDTEQTRIAVGHPSSDGGSFDQSNHPLLYHRCKPMVRADEVMRRIFEQHGFTFNSELVNNVNPEYRRLYVSAFGNDKDLSISNLGSNSNLAQWYNPPGMFLPENGTNPIGNTPIQMSNVFFDYGDNLTQQINTFNQPYQQYNIPQTGDYTVEFFYPLRFRIRDGFYGQWALSVFNPSDVFDVYVYQFTVQPGTGDCSGGTEFTVTRQEGAGTPILLETQCQNEAFFEDGEGFTYDAYIWNYSVGLEFPMTITSITFPLVGGFWKVQSNDSVNNVVSMDGGGFVWVKDAVGDFTLASEFSNDYKCIDFIKDYFAMHRMLMIPNPDNITDFTLIPWTNYIGRGRLKDWSTKLNKDKDLVIRPLLLDQTDRFTLKMQSDSDVYNKLNEDIFSEPYGTRKLDSVYDILKGETVIETKLAATPGSQIEGYDADWDDILVNQIHAHEVEDGLVLHQPIKPKTRMLYYNGLKNIGGTSTFFMEDTDGTVVEFDEFPVVSHFTQMPNGGPNNKAMLFERETNFDQAGTLYQTSGQDLYTRYWSRYLELIYNRDARRVTAYFSLDNDDILDFRYNDVIYVEGNYYYIEKIYDAPLGQSAKVKVDLITLLDYRPNVTAEQPAVNQLWEDVDDNWEEVSDEWQDV